MRSSAILLAASSNVALRSSANQLFKLLCVSITSNLLYGPDLVVSRCAHLPIEGIELVSHNIMRRREMP